MLGLYIHIPFCASKCAYCDFYSVATDRAGYLDAVKRDIPKNHQFDTIYIGGGTPTIFSPEQLQGLLDHIGAKNATEITLEANPEDLTNDYITRLTPPLHAKGAQPHGRERVVEKQKIPLHVKEGCPQGGVVENFNRLSIGIQSFDDEILRFLNRRHNAERAKDVVRAAQRAGFDNISIDLIYGIPGMSLEQWEHSLDEALKLDVQHISAYHLTIEKGTPLEKLKPIPEDDSEKQYALLCEKLKKAGFDHYEISNFAKPGFRAIHNSNYWNGTPYVGIGPSAHSFDGERTRSRVKADVKSYIEKGAEYETETLSDRDIYNEKIMLGLRTKEGAVVDGQKIVISEDKWLTADYIISNLFK